MKIEEKDKQVWQTPEIVDLDVKDDTKAKGYTTGEGSGFGFS